MTSPLSTFEGTLKQITPECLTDRGRLVVQVCAPLFLSRTEEQRQKIFQSQRPDLDPRVKHFYVMTRPFRRFSGDYIFEDPNDSRRLSAGNYFAVCVDESGLDYGTLVNELNAYRSTDARFECAFLGCLDPETQRRFGLPPSPQPLTLVGNSSELLGAMPNDAPAELISDIRRAVAGNCAFVQLLGIRVTQAKIEGVLDLRERLAQEWFFERYVPKTPIPTQATRFLDILPELLQPSLGGSTGSNTRLQALGADLRKLGVNGLIYPSARADIAVEYRNGRVHRSKGWNMVLYRTPAPRDVISVDFGGWETKFWKGVRLEERQIDAESEGWYVVGLEAVQHLKYLDAMKVKRM